LKYGAGNEKKIKGLRLKVGDIDGIAMNLSFFIFSYDYAEKADWGEICGGF